MLTPKDLKEEVSYLKKEIDSLKQRKDLKTEIVKPILWFLGFIITLIVVSFTFSYQFTPQSNISSSDSFVGIIATLIGIMVTFVIAYQIYNAVESNAKIKELELKIESKLEVLDTLRIEVEESILDLKSELYINRAKMQESSKEYNNAIISYIFALGLRINRKIDENNIKLSTTGNFEYRTEIPICNFEYRILKIFEQIIINAQYDSKSTYSVNPNIVKDILDNEFILKEFPGLKNNTDIKYILKTSNEIQDIFNGCSKKDINKIIEDYQEYIKAFERINSSSIKFII